MKVVQKPKGRESTIKQILNISKSIRLSFTVILLKIRLQFNNFIKSMLLKKLFLKYWTLNHNLKYVLEK